LEREGLEKGILERDVGRNYTLFKNNLKNSMFTVPPAVALLNYIKIRELYHTSLKDQQSCDGRGVLRVKEPRGRVCAIHGRARAAKTTSKQIVPYSTHTACVLMDKYFI
jgi:hypothetical protein